MQKPRFLVVGLGGIGQRHVRNLRALLGDRVEIGAYRVRNLPVVLTERLEIEQGIPLAARFQLQLFSELGQALMWKPDAVFVCNPTSEHLAVALAAAEAGCHLFMEKPLANTLDGVPELVELVENQGLISLVGYQLRFHPCLQRLHELLRQRVIGRALAVRAEMGEYLPAWHPYEDYRQMYAAQRTLGGGVLLSQIHDLDYLYALFGLPRRLFALGGQLSSLEVDVEDVASVLMECEVDGYRIPVHLHQDYLQRPPSRTCQVIGNDGKILVDFRALSVTVWDKDGEVTEASLFHPYERNLLFLDELKHFLACLAGEQTPIVTLREGAQSLRMALAARDSLATGNVVVLS